MKNSYKAPKVVGIYLGVKDPKNPEARAEIISVDQAEAEKGLGLRGDRYNKNIWLGTFCKPGSAQKNRELSIFSYESWQAANARLEAMHGPGAGFLPEETRRNVMVRGIDLSQLRGRFWLGDIPVEYDNPCAPCNIPSEAAGKPGYREAYKGVDDMRVRILGDGILRLGDPVYSLYPTFCKPGSM